MTIIVSVCVGGWTAIIIRLLGEYWLTPLQAIWLHALVTCPDSYTSRFFKLNIFQTIGNWSYACYLCHMFVLGAYLWNIEKIGLGDWPMMWYHFPGAISLVALSSWLLYRFIENPCRNSLVAWYETANA